jgi:hypothetical protein
VQSPCCLTGLFHSAVKLHGFLAYMIRVALRGETYNIILDDIVESVCKATAAALKSQPAE